VNLAGDDFGDFGETDAVFVTEGQIAQQIAGGEESAVFEKGGAVGADAAKKSDGSCQGDAHAFRISAGCCLIRVPGLAGLLYHR
jgi:hypothetical protein